jgi:hypothetical protein
VGCQRLDGHHDGIHAAYIFSITTPETWTTSAVYAAMYPRCRDADAEVLPDGRPGRWYRVHDELWAAAGMTEFGGFLCLDCLESRLGRPLTGADFPTEWEINRPPRLPRYQAARTAEARRPVAANPVRKEHTRMHPRYPHIPWLGHRRWRTYVFRQSFTSDELLKACDVCYGG